MFERTFLNDTHQSILNNHQVNKNQTVTKYFMYSGGKCIYTNSDYQADNITDEESHLTSVNLDTSIYDTHPESISDLNNYLGSRRFNQVWSQIIHIMRQTAVVHKNIFVIIKILIKVLDFNYLVEILF